MSNPDKLIFLVKDMVSSLNKQFKKSMNPFWVAKLDLHSINNFNFPDLKKTYFEEKGEQDSNFNRKFTELQV